LLSEKEKRSIRIDALREESRNERLQTRALVRTVLAKYVGSRTPPEELEFTYNEKGKPFLREEFNRDRMIQFSVSHSENLIAMAVATDGRRVGVDCEVEERRTKESCAKLAKRYFSKSAYERINSALENDEDDGRRMFVKYWCLCESYVKALGVGISGRPFKYFDIKQTKSSEIKLEETNVEECGKWAFELFRENRTKSIVAVCAEDADKKRARKLPIVASFRHIKPLLDEEDAYEELLSNRRTSKHSNDLEILGH
jgi:phosphopantetheinyl transferase